MSNVPYDPARTPKASNYRIMKRSETDMKLIVNDSVIIAEKYYNVYSELKDNVYERGTIVGVFDGLLLANFNGKEIYCSPDHLTKLYVFESQSMKRSETDMTTPDGAERHCYNLLHPYLKMVNGIVFYFHNVWQSFEDRVEALGFWTSATILPAVTTEQDLTTLDVPFGELDRDTQLRLVNHVLDGGITDKYLKGKWVISGGHDRMLLCFCNDRKYRAVANQVKQPTELETLKAKLDKQWLAVHATIEQMNGIK